MTARRRWQLGSALALAIAAIALATWRARREPPEAVHSAAVPGAPVAAAPPAHATSTGRPALVPQRGVVPDPEHGRAGVATDDPLTAYQKLNVYPPTSRPLSRDHADLLRPNQRHEQRRSTDADDGVDFLFTADRYFVLGDEVIAPVLEVRRGGVAIPVAIAQAFAAVVDPKDRDPARFPFELRGATQRTGTFGPAAMQLGRQSTVGMYVEFEYDGTRQRASFNFQYTPEAGIPARFTGAFRDAVEAGSLVVRAGVAVARGGRYVIDCNLYDAADNPVAWTRAKAELAPPAREVSLVFFGKVLADQRARGPFHLGQLRGARFDPGRDPDLEQMPPFAGSYATEAYAADVFSDAEWDSPEKQRMVRFLAEQQQQGLHQGAATPAPRGAPGDDK